MLVSSGGLGREVSLLLRAAALPGAELVLPLLVPRWLGRAAGGLGWAGTRLGLRPSPDMGETGARLPLARRRRARAPRSCTRCAR